MANRSKIAQLAFDLAEPVVSGLGYDLVDAEYKKEGPSYFLRIYIYKKGGIGIEDCERISKTLDPIFDHSLPTTPDFFEVSSPGLDRPLTTEADFARYEGEEVEIELTTPADGLAKMEGTILRVEQGDVYFSYKGKDIRIAIDEIAIAKRCIRF